MTREEIIIAEFERRFDEVFGDLTFNPDDMGNFNSLQLINTDGTSCHNWKLEGF